MNLAEGCSDQARWLASESRLRASAGQAEALKPWLKRIPRLPELRFAGVPPSLSPFPIIPRVSSTYTRMDNVTSPLLVAPTTASTLASISPQTLAVSLLALLAALLISRRSSSKGPLPPGPKGWPVIGNMLQLPKSRPWVKMEEWTREYGEWGRSRTGLPD